MIESCPSTAAGSPPDTGASTASTPRSASAACTSRAVAGAMVDMSITSMPSRTPAITPSSPRITASTSGESGSMVITTSERSATSRGVVAVSAPAAASSSTAAELRLWTTTGKPALTRRAAMGLPMMPRPMKPMRSLMAVGYPSGRRP